MSGQNILVAEDNDVSRKLIVSILQQEGYQTFEALDGAQAWAMVQDDTHHFDAAVIDQKMAPEGGFDFARHMISSRIALPMVMVTADQSTDLLIEASKLGIKRVLQKPIEPDRLINVVNRIFDNQSHGRREDILPRSTAYDKEHGCEELLQRAVILSRQVEERNVGSAVGAVVSDAQGKILGEGQYSVSFSRDPMALAEIIALQRASQKCNGELPEGCVIYCARRPIYIGLASIAYGGVRTVIYKEDNKPYHPLDDDLIKYYDLTVEPGR